LQRDSATRRTAEDLVVFISKLSTQVCEGLCTKHDYVFFSRDSEFLTAAYYVWHCCWQVPLGVRGIALRTSLAIAYIVLAYGRPLWTYSRRLQRVVIFLERVVDTVQCPNNGVPIKNFSGRRRHHVIAPAVIIAQS